MSESTPPTTMRARLNEAIRLVDAIPHFDRDYPETYNEVRNENLLSSIAHSLVILAAGQLAGSVVEPHLTTSPPPHWRITEQVASALSDRGYRVPAGQPLTEGTLDFEVLEGADGSFAERYRLTITPLPTLPSGTFF